VSPSRPDTYARSPSTATKLGATAAVHRTLPSARSRADVFDGSSPMTRSTPPLGGATGCFVVRQRSLPVLASSTA
jgi:hypothetical protein